MNRRRRTALGGVGYLRRDEFTTALAAGSVNGTAAEPGPGLRTVVDAGNNLSIVSGAVHFAENTGGAPSIAFGQSWVKGMGFTTKITSNSTGYFIFRLGTDTSNSYYNFTSTVIKRNANDTSLFPTTASSPYYVGLFNGQNRSFLLTKTGTNYNLAWIENTVTTGTGLYLAGGTGITDIDFIRIPTTLWLPTPLLSTSGAMTWPISNGLGHAEGVAGGLGAGGSGLTMLDAGTWSVAGGYVLNTPVLGVESITNPGFEGTYVAGLAPDWSKYGTPTVSEATGADTHGGSSAQSWTQVPTGQQQLYQYLNQTLGKWYIASVWGKRIAGSGGTAMAQVNTGNSIYISMPAWTSASYTQKMVIWRSIETSAVLKFSVINDEGNSGDTIIIDDASFKPLPISTLITNCQLSTTDILAEEVIHVRTVGTQVGMARNLCRSFAAKCAVQANAGQAVIALKEVTGVGGVGLSINDTITIVTAPGVGVTYAIASVTGGSNVAYNDTLKTQTITLGTSLGAEVLADAKVGLDWASWNGVLCYFDGSGNVKLDEVVAGVYTNRGSTAVTFVADKRFIVRLIAGTYYIFFNETLVGSAVSTVAAAARAGKYHGMFSTYNLNTVGSMVVYDTGNVTNLYSNLDRYSS